MKKAIVLLMCLCLIGCSTSQVSVTLEAASLAVNVAASVVQQTVVDPVLKSQIVGYLTIVSSGLASAGVDLQNGTLTGAELAKIIATLTNAAVPLLPDSVPNAVKVALMAVAGAVGAFLAIINPAGVVVAQNTSYKFTLSRNDKKLVQKAMVELYESNVMLSR